jgi:hypothetical protein
VRDSYDGERENVEMINGLPVRTSESTRALSAIVVNDSVCEREREVGK